jgi:hypothetical protein
MNRRRRRRFDGECLNSVFLTKGGFADVFGGLGFMPFVFFAGFEVGALEQSAQFILIKVTADSGQHIFRNQ